ncbi:ABC transporter permease [Gorillibacterium sp. sgz500922]|uniref:ABC transporter permease n=1 Tax=Gorillibacterium sp. sgz500922 TaxID=3446694 RepID=UPI003F66A4CE
MWTRVAKHHLFWPFVILAGLLLFNLIYKPWFFSIQVKNGHLYGSLIDIINFGAPLALVAIGMTLIIATKGIDLSVGSVIALSGAISCLLISKAGDQNTLSIVLLSVGAALALSLFAGLWNGTLVSVFGIQPIVATLILMVAGRGVAQLITGGQIITVSSHKYEFIGAGWLFMLPFSVFIVAVLFIAALFLTRKTALGLFIESVGSNPTASRLMGIRSRTILLAVYLFGSLCAGIAGLIISSNVSSADGNNAGLWYELDAILAVVIGGTSMNGGRFYLSGSLIGAMVIQTLTTTIYMTGIPSDTILVVKAVVVFAVCLIQSEKFRKKVFRSRKATAKPNESEVARSV